MSHHIFKRLLVGLLFGIYLTGCTVFTPVKGQPAATFTLNQIPAFSNSFIATSRPSKVLIVGIPKANSSLNTSRMLYIDKLYQIKYFMHNRWIDTPAKMIQPLLVQTLQNTRQYRAVVAEPFVTNSDLRLDTEIQQLQQEFFQRPSVIRIQINAQISDSLTRKIIATQQFTISAPAAIDNPYGGVITINKAMVKILQEIAQFCVKLDLRKTMLGAAKTSEKPEFTSSK